MRTKLRNALCGILACGMLAGLVPMPAGAATSLFYDVPGDAWYSSAVSYVYDANLMSGVEEKSFGPSIEATRAQIVTILYRMTGQPAVSGKAAYKDVAGNSYYNAPIAWATAVGIATGDGNGYFQPSGAVTREQLAVMLYRYAACRKFDVSKKANLTQFSDHWQISAYAQNAISWAVGSGLMNGTDGQNFSPFSLTSRAVLATTLMRFCNLYNVKVPSAGTTVAVVAVSQTPAAATPAVTASTAAKPAATTTIPAASVPTAQQPAASGATVSAMTLDGSMVQTPQYTFQWPLQGTLSSGYGTRFIFGSTSFHRGIDIAAPLGTAIHAGQSGTVSFAGEQGSYGNLVIIDHGNGFQSYYGHNAKLLVSKGDVVQKNQVIAACGATGRATGNHCHFEVHYKGQVVDPMVYLPAKNNAPANTTLAVSMAEQAEPEVMSREALVLASIY